MPRPNHRTGRPHGYPVPRGPRDATPWWTAGTLPAGVATALVGVFLTVLAGSLAVTLAGVRPAPAWGWVEGLVPVFASLALLASLAGRLPLQNALACGAMIGVTAGMVVAVAVHTRFPLGRFEFSDVSGPRLLGLVAWPVPFLWVALLLSSRQCGKLILRPWRRHRHYGWLLLGVSVVLVLLLTLVLEPFGQTVKGWWTWQLPAGTAGWQGAPVALLPAVAVLTALLLLGATMWLIPKRPTGLPPERTPAVIWLALDLWLTLGCLRAGLPLPAGLGLAAAAGVAWLAWRGHRAGTVTPAARPPATPDASVAAA